ncbi:MAG: c-type cytochrome [Acidobacteriia bacterium]|nr:c-type cytochrome [Terriglobia bacterium]
MQKSLIFIAIAGLAVIVYAQQPPPTIQRVTPSRTSPASGEEMFRAYCAVCHGVDAKGNGPAAPALKMMPADLTALAKENKGKYPELRVYSAITGEVGMPAHGSQEMPIWGEVFRSMSGGSDAQIKMRVRNLTKYVGTLQVK